MNTTQYLKAGHHRSIGARHGATELKKHMYGGDELPGVVDHRLIESFVSFRETFIFKALIDAFAR